MAFNDWIENIAHQRAGIGAFRFNNRDYEQERRLFAPVKDWACDIGCAGYLSREYLLAEQQAEGLRLSLTDETIPLEQKLLFNKSVFQGGRINNALLIGIIRYSKALPQLREAAIHDLNECMRHECVDAMGNMDVKFSIFAEDTMQILEHDSSTYVKMAAAQAIRKIGDLSFSYRLLEQAEEAAKLAKIDFQNYLRNSKEGINALSQSSLLYRFLLESLVALNPKIGREALKKGLQSDSPPVHHEAKNTCLLSGNMPLVKPQIYLARDTCKKYRL